MITSSITRVPPRTVARRLRSILFPEDIGVLMATRASHKLGDVSCEKFTLAAFHTEEDNAYIGHFIEGAGLIDLVFPKSGCRWLTEEEVAVLVRKRLKFSGPLQAATLE